ncbi:hydrogen peroxide-inducible genes activator [Brevundimonas sp. S30B]|uniref:hydrogen peroxide-inducible genes activator n=1 Tax=unclassified Brevundimonas TaxID=2622653 RepID=UPI001072C0EB|nr:MULTISPECIES: hydrogen peroxide-inducible genes activator [unclassified Brevundimonas]QBX36518.1 hydrogen peroxide-inducible genes activator [Brevundimonas sp. MF30-B]TFW00818.1 hydrogen peroxide-inducible genes activator [Brevundimonas sp. S30B]
MLPTLRQLQYLKLLAEHGSFSRAAEAAHVSQPALSAGVQELERILGAPVVERTRGNVQLTAVGVEAVRRAEQVLTQAEDLVVAARNAGRPLSGRFRLGIIPTVAPFLLPAKLPGLKEKHPALRLFIREDLTPRLIAGLKGGQLDAAVIALPYTSSGIQHARIGDDEILAAAPRGHSLAGVGPLPAGALKADDLILLEDGHCLRDQALAAIDLEAPRGDDVFAATSLHTLVQMVSSGLGVSFLPRMAVKAGLADDPGVVVRPISADAPKREIVVAWRTGSSRAEEARLLAEALTLD